MWTSIGLLATLVTASVATYVAQSNCILRTRDLCQPTLQEMRDAFTQFMIVPQIIPAPPRSLVTKYYNRYTMCIGNRIPPWETTILPFTSWPNVNPNSFHTILAIDPDNPQFFTTTEQYLVELIINIPGANFAAGTVLTPFKPIAPLPGSGDHRIIYLVFRQLGFINMTAEEKYVYATNFSFSVANFTGKYMLGTPIAGNFFVSSQTLCKLPCDVKDSKDSCECGEDCEVGSYYKNEKCY